MNNNLNESQNYQTLTPDNVLNAVETTGLFCTGKLQILNSFENRVYLIGIDDSPDLIAKFYRPLRWSNEQIQDEHDFCLELAEAELPVVSPISINGETLFTCEASNNDEDDKKDSYDTYRFALFEKKGGRAPDLENFETLEQLGTFLGRIHLIGRTKPFTARPRLDQQTFGVKSRSFILENDFIAPDLRPAYESLTKDLLVQIGYAFERAGEIDLIRTHSDFHPGNILWTDDGAHIVDLDDCRMTPACQDLWMLLSGDRPNMTAQLDAVLEGYTQFCDFNSRELHLIEALRTLRLMHYYYWLAKRWEDPAFKMAFPWFNTQRCWEEHILHLREQAANMQEAPLQWHG